LLENPSEYAVRAISNLNFNLP